MPYSIGIGAAADSFTSAGFSTQLVCGIVACLAILLIVHSYEGEAPDLAPSLPGLSLLAIYPYFQRRFDFLNWGFYVTKSSIFKFKLLRNDVFVLSGESARQAFFTSRSLDLTQGFLLLSGAIPMMQDVTSGLQAQRVGLIHKRLVTMQRNASISQLIPEILSDTRRKMESWGNDGAFDPFDKIYELLFQTTVRCLSCSEIADDPIIVARLKVLYDDLDTATTPTSVLLPWLPTPSMIKKVRSTKAIYDIINSAIRARKEGGVAKCARNDALQMLLDFGDEKRVIVGFIMGLLIAGARATGTTSCWISVYLSSHPEWRAKLTEEVKSLLASCSPSPLSPLLSSNDVGISLEKQLACIPLETWESEMPVMDSIIRETLRIAEPHFAMRRNLGPDMHIDGKIIPSGSYVGYPFSAVHLDENLYPEPWKFDPGRPEPPKEVPFSWVGWGVGKTTCLGTRLAKLEMKLIMSMFVLGFNSSVVDTQGNLIDAPTPNWNDSLVCRPEEPFNIKYKRTDVPL